MRTISPRENLDNMYKGEEISYTLDITAELGDNTINTSVYKVLDSTGGDVTTNFGGGSSVSSGIISFGVKAYEIGSYTLDFTITCNETLPDSSTPYEFMIKMMKVQIVS